MFQTLSFFQLSLSPTHWKTLPVTLFTLTPSYIEISLETYSNYPLHCTSSVQKQTCKKVNNRIHLTQHRDIPPESIPNCNNKKQGQPYVLERRGRKVPLNVSYKTWHRSTHTLTGDTQPPPSSVYLLSLLRHKNEESRCFPSHFTTRPIHTPALCVWEVTGVLLGVCVCVSTGIVLCSCVHNMFLFLIQMATHPLIFPQ